LGFSFNQTDDPTVAELHIVQGTGYDKYRYPAEYFRKFTEALNALSPCVEMIDVKINSYGMGCGHIAISMYNLLRGWRGRVVTSVDCAWSASALVSQAGSVRRMAADGIFGTHNSVLRVDLEVMPGGIGIFPASDLRKYADQLDEQTELNVCIFAERSGHSASDVRALFDKDDCMNAEECKAFGVIDEITAPHGRQHDWPEHLLPRVNAAYARAAGSG
jgi:ATP-dependent protease ClpP protease subunit